MTRFSPPFTLSALAAATLFCASPAAHAQFTATVFATGAAVSGTRPDSITYGGGHVFVQYGNGADSAAPLGTGGASTIAEYDLSGNVLNTFSALGSADGVRYNPATGLLWVMQNQDGNSALETIDPTNGLTTHYTYPSSTPGRGYDDAAFTNGNAYLSYTNPGNAPGTPTPVIYQATLGAGVVNLSPILSVGDTGQPNTSTDVDSLDVTPDGSLLLTGGDDGTLTTVKNPGTASQSFSSITVANGSGLDDTVFASGGPQRLLVSDTANNTIYAVSGPFQAGGAYASIGGLHSVDAVDMTTGATTSISGGLFGANASPHGEAFIPAAVPEASTTVSLGLLLVFGLGGLLVRSRRRA